MVRSALNRRVTVAPETQRAVGSGRGNRVDDQRQERDPYCGPRAQVTCLPNLTTTRYRRQQLNRTSLKMNSRITP